MPTDNFGYVPLLKFKILFWANKNGILRIITGENTSTSYTTPVL